MFELCSITIIIHPRARAQVIVSHDREFLDQLCTKVVEVERGESATYVGNYSDFQRQKETLVAQQWAAWERQQKEIERQTDLINRLSGGGQAGRAEAAKKALEKIKSEEQLLERPWVEKRRPFTFPEPPRSGQLVISVDKLTFQCAPCARPASSRLRSVPALALLLRPRRRRPRGGRVLRRSVRGVLCGARAAGTGNRSCCAT